MSKPHTLSDNEKSYIHGQVMAFGAAHAYFKAGSVSAALITRMIETGRMVEQADSIDRHLPIHNHGEVGPRTYELTPAGIEWIYTCKLLSDSEVVEAKKIDAEFGKPSTSQPIKPTASDDKAISDSRDATIESVLEAAKTQISIHFRDVSFIMDRLSVRQCRAFVQHEGFTPNRDLAWAIELGLIAANGAFTNKGSEFLRSIY